MTQEVYNNTKHKDLFAYINKLEAEIAMLKEKEQRLKSSLELIAKTNRPFPNA